MKYRIILIALIFIIGPFLCTAKDARSFALNIDDDGKIYIGEVEISVKSFKAICKDALSEYGSDIPFGLRVDKDCSFSNIFPVLNILSDFSAYNTYFLSKMGRTCNGHGFLQFTFIKDKRIATLKDDNNKYIKIITKNGIYKVNGKEITLQQIDKVISSFYKKDKSVYDNLKDYLYSIPLPQKAIIHEGLLPKTDDHGDKDTAEKKRKTIVVKVQEIKPQEIEEIPCPLDTEDIESDSDREENITAEQNHDVFIYCSDDTKFSKFIELLYLIRQYNLTPVIIKLNHNKKDVINPPLSGK